jgi:hypothetical protein
MRRLGLAIVFAATLGTVTGAGAQTYPTRPITRIVPFAAGGPNDTIGRIMAERMDRVVQQSLKSIQPIEKGIQFLHRRRNRLVGVPLRRRRGGLSAGLKIAGRGRRGCIECLRRWRWRSIEPVKIAGHGHRGCIEPAVVAATRHPERSHQRAEHRKSGE